MLSTLHSTYSLLCSRPLFECDGSEAVKAVKIGMLRSYRRPGEVMGLRGCGGAFVEIAAHTQRGTRSIGQTEYLQGMAMVTLQINEPSTS